MKPNQTDGVRSQYTNDRNLKARIRMHELYSTNQEGWNAWVFKHMSFRPRSRVLELGCGTGTVWVENGDSIPRDVDFVLSDFSDGMLASAKANVSKIAGNFEFLRIDAQDIPFETSSFDTCIANHMLYHVPDLPKALSEIRRVLRPGGTLYATTVGEKHLVEIREMLNQVDEQIDFHGSIADGFNLQNGAGILGDYFVNVEVRAYEDSLRITDARDLVDYVMSSAGISNATSLLCGENLDRLESELEKEISRNGHIHVSKESGIFIAN